MQGSPVAWDPQASLDQMVAEVHRLRRTFPATRLVTYPEYYLTGFQPHAPAPEHAPDWDDLAEPIPGPMSERLADLATETGLWLLPGTYCERGEDGSVYNTAIAISPSGKVVAKYRKCFPWRPFETVAAGQDFVVFDIEGVGRAGLMTCYDGWFPECARQLAWMGAEVIFQASATFTSDRAQEVVLARATAIANQVLVVNVNAGSPGGTGMSVIADAEGHVLQAAGETVTYLTEVLDFDAVARVREFGSVGLSKVWDQLDSEGPKLSLPMYGGTIRPRPAGGGRSLG